MRERLTERYRVTDAGLNLRKEFIGLTAEDIAILAQLTGGLTTWPTIL